MWCGAAGYIKKDMAFRGWYENVKLMAKCFCAWLHSGTGRTHFHAAERPPDSASACLHPWLSGGDNLPLARCVVSWVIGEIWGTGTCKGHQNVSLQVHEDDVENYVLWGLGEEETSFCAPTVLLPLLWGRGMQSLLGCHLCSPSRAQHRAAEQRVNRNMWETAILGLGNFRNTPKKFW